MNYSMIRYILACVLSFEGIFLVLPAIVGGIYGEKEGWIYFIIAIACFVIGTVGRLKKPRNIVFYSKEGFAAVALSWIVLSLAGALPFVLTGEIPHYIDALFETISGFTTTGSSILSDVEALSKASIFWRSFTHWVGGMGVLVFILAILPLSGGSNMHLMRAESPGPTVGKLVPKIKRTAMILYGIYMVFTVVEIVMLLIAGLDWFSSMTLTFGTVGTGGFGILNSSIASYSGTVQTIIAIFMIISAINFNVYYLVIIGKMKEALFHEEMRYYLIVVITSTLLIMVNIRDNFATITETFRHSLFQVASITSSTGYATVDFDMWPGFSKTIILLLMFMGACAGSTGGGFKVSRLIIIAKAIKNEIVSIAHPRSVQHVVCEGRKVSNETVKKVLCYTGVYIFVAMISLLIVSIDGKDITTNISAVIATLNNIGPGLGAVGPTCNFGDYSILSKIVFMFDMLAGRLEILPVLILFAPGIWKLSKKR